MMSLALKIYYSSQMALCGSCGWLRNHWSEEREGKYPDIKKKMLICKKKKKIVKRNF